MALITPRPTASSESGEMVSGRKKRGGPAGEPPKIGHCVDPGWTWDRRPGSSGSLITA